MKILAIGGSNSKHSINRALAYFTAELFDNAAITKVDISKMDISMFSVDKEAASGIPDPVTTFAKQMDESDLIILSLAENNGSFNVGLKNLLDWTSRIKGRKTFNNKPMLLMATSPGARGATSVLASAKSLFPFAGAVIKATYSLPEFHKNFDVEQGITNTNLLNELKTLIQQIYQHDRGH
jgi:NAD(P)H-dependent FMN reductase